MRSLLNLPLSRAAIGTERHSESEGELLLIMTGRLAPGLTIGESLIHGKGCFAAVAFYEDQQIAEYVGERISMIEAERRRRAFGEDYICDVDNEWAIDGSRGGNVTQYVNHSCQPNSYVIVSERRIFIHALKEITPSEEITTDYLYELHSDNTTGRCRTATCDEPTSLAGFAAAYSEANQTIDQHSGHPALEGL